MVFFGVGLLLHSFTHKLTKFFFFFKVYPYLLFCSVSIGNRIFLFALKTMVTINVVQTELRRSIDRCVATKQQLLNT